MTIYLAVEGLAESDAEKISTEFSKEALVVQVRNLKGANYVFKIDKLAGGIDTQKSAVKLKSNELVIQLYKEKEDKWDSLEYQPPKETPKIDKNEDPQKGMMNLMKEMYDKGDDNMKRTISEAFHKAQTAKN